jgi:hypothetical protein
MAFVRCKTTLLTNYTKDKLYPAEVTFGGTEVACVMNDVGEWKTFEWKLFFEAV